VRFRSCIQARVAVPTVLPLHYPQVLAFNQRRDSTPAHHIKHVGAGLCATSPGITSGISPGISKQHCHLFQAGTTPAGAAEESAQDAPL
jgi:hypothetical protein